ncbi:MAG: small metal-binding protein SmbP [Gammaproteobacteria bacterium]
MKNTISTVLLAWALAIGMSNAFAQQGAGPGKSGDENTKNMADAKMHATAALEAAKAGQAAEVLEHAKAAWKVCKEITGETVMPYYEGAMEKLNAAITAAEKGDAAAAVSPLEGAIANMSEGQAKADY